MFEKVLIAEDHEIANISVQKTLHDLGIVDARYVYYCDHAITWIKKSLVEGEPYDLLITDLQFEDDGNTQNIQGGFDLICAAKITQPDLKIIILTAKDSCPEIQGLLDQGVIHGYVRKARRDAQHLQEALIAISNNKSYHSPQQRKVVQEKYSHEFTALDLHIVRFLYEGISQKEMPIYLQQRDIRPSSLSSIEKRLSLMKEVFGFSKNEQLVAYCKEMSII